MQLLKVVLPVVDPAPDMEQISSVASNPPNPTKINKRLSSMSCFTQFVAYVKDQKFEKIITGL